jgi:hypothetical protein
VAVDDPRAAAARSIAVPAAPQSAIVVVECIDIDIDVIKLRSF